jgi:signal transduction histidine kinase/DNA-binding response OmpR family regulator/ligand-binding sensor domain-containing protein
MNIFARISLYLFISFFIISNAPLTAQYGPVTYQDVGKLEDYSNPQCLSLYQDSRGLLWISNWGGLDRWDGNRMVSYPYTPFDSIGYPARAGARFSEDDQNNLWFSVGELARFDLEKEVFERIPISYESTSLDIMHVEYDSKGFLWLVCEEGIFQYHPDTEILQQIPLLEADGTEASEFRPRKILSDTIGRAWLADNLHGLCYFDPEKKIFKVHPLDLPEFVDKTMNLREMNMDPEGNFWLFGRKAELARFNPYNGEFEWAGMPFYNKFATSTGGGMAIDNQGRIWYGVERGLMLYDPVSKTVTPMDPPNTRKKIITEIISDKHGNIMVATFEGVKIIDSRNVTIRTINLTQELTSEVTSWISSVVRDKQTLWMGTHRTGIIRYNLETNQYVTFQADGQPGSIHNNFVHKTLRDRDGRIWFFAGSLLYRLNPDNESFEYVLMSPSHIITQCDDGFFWIMGLDRIVRFDPITRDTAHIAFQNPLPHRDIYNQLDLIPFIKDKEGIFWFAQQDNGLYSIDPGNGQWTHYEFDENNPDGLPDQHVKNLFCDSRGTIWLSTWTGLSRMIQNPGNDTAISFDNHYITDLHIGHTSKITEDEYGNVFVGTLTGVIVIRPDGTIDTYTHKDGLPKDLSIIWLVDRDHENGDIYLGSAEIVIIPPSFLAPNMCTAPTIFTEFRMGGEKIDPGEASPLKSSILVADRIDLRHDQNFFRINFATLYFSHPERNRYRYILEGIDQDTVYSGNQSFAEYTDLAPGKYTFWVSGAIHRGPWNPEGRYIEIIIEPPWYSSQVAKSGYFLVLLLLILGYVRIRTEKLRKEKIVLEAQVVERTAEIRQKNEKIVEMERLKTRFFTDVSHEIRTPLSLITGPLDVLMKQEHPDPKTESRLSMIKRNSQRLLQLVNQLLDISRLDSGHMKLVLENSDIMKHIGVLANEYHSLAEKNHICYILDIPESGIITWNDRDKINKVATNLLSNAFKFTPEFGTITCRAKILTDSNDPKLQQLRIIVADTGPGIPSGEHEKIFERFYRAARDHNVDVGGTGIGLSLTREMVNLLHGDIRVKSLVGKGTVFIATVPLGKEHLKEKEFILKEHEQPIPQEIVSEDTTGEAIYGGEFTNLGMSILIVEDNDEVRSFIKENLQPNYKILEAEDGLKGLTLATSVIPDLIISDIMMPGMDGKKMCEKLKNDERTSHIPLIMLTARATTHDKIEGLECGADDYIFKPFSIEEIEARICNLLEQRERLRKKYSGYIGLDWSEITVTTLDEQFLKKVTDTISAHLHDFKFDVGILKDKMVMSRSTLFKKLKALTGESPNSLIRIMRLKLAASMIEKSEKNITEILMSVGFSNPSYFARCFRAYFGVTPKAYQKSFNKPD